MRSFIKITTIFLDTYLVQHKGVSRRFRFETRTCKYLNTYWFHFLASPLILDRARCFKNIVGYPNGGGAHTKMHFKTCQNPKVMARLSWICTWSMEKTTSNHEFTEPLLVQHCYFEDILWLQKYSKHFALWFLIKLILKFFFASRHLWNHKQHKVQIIAVITCFCYVLIMECTRNSHISREVSWLLALIITTLMFIICLHL